MTPPDRQRETQDDIHAAHTRRMASGDAVPPPPPRPVMQAPPPRPVPTAKQPQTNDAIPIVRESAPAGAGDPDEGRMVGPYRISRALARGGMGAVYLAEDVALRRTVALKLMMKELLTDEDALKRFQREARATAAINHVNVAVTWLVGEADDGSPFLAMEYVNGGSLLDHIRNRTPLSFSQIADIFAQAAEGLRAARKMQIIHRDLKPANIMLTREGVVKIVDFGLAKVLFEDTYRTMEGMVLGTPKYMSPEQVQSRETDHRSDIYSLGATMYQVMTGRPAFDGETSVQIMMKHVSAPLVPMRSINPAIPIEFDNVIARMMRKELADRYQEYDELIVDLKGLKLQAMAQEHGSVIGADGRAAPPPASREQSLSPTMLQGPASVHSSRGPAADGTTPVFEEVERRPMPPALIAAIVAVAIFIIFIMVTLAMKKDDEPPVAVAPPAPERRAGLALLIEKLAQESEKGDAVAADARAAMDTIQTIETLGPMIRAFHSSQNRYPGSLAELIRHFDIGGSLRLDPASGEPLDGWGVFYLYEPTDGIIRSAGKNGNYEDGDDILFRPRLGVDVPEIYDTRG